MMPCPPPAPHEGDMHSKSAAAPPNSTHGDAGSAALALGATCIGCLVQLFLFGGVCWVALAVFRFVTGAK